VQFILPLSADIEEWFEAEVKAKKRPGKYISIV
jgi:hypothetical protein